MPVPQPGRCAGRTLTDSKATTVDLADQRELHRGDLLSQRVDVVHTGHQLIVGQCPGRLRPTLIERLARRDQCFLHTQTLGSRYDNFLEHKCSSA